jgi:hypothetical protein
VLGIDKSIEGTNCHGRLNGLYTDEAVSCHKCVIDYINERAERKKLIEMYGFGVPFSLSYNFFLKCRFFDYRNQNGKPEFQ